MLVPPPFLFLAASPSFLAKKEVTMNRFLHEGFLKFQFHNIKTSLPSVGNENIEFPGKEANRQINCPIQTGFCSSQTGRFYQ